MKRIITALAITALALTGCVTKIVENQEDLPTAKYEVEFLKVADMEEPADISSMVAEPEPPQAAGQEPVEETYHEPAYSAPVYYDDAPSYDNGDGFASQGRRYYNGGTETWYTSPGDPYDVQDQWTVDDEGYFRDQDGYYVVASDEYGDGEIIDTSKGEARVWDHGSGVGNTDFYVDF